MKVKRIYRKIIYSILVVLICVSLSGCTVGEYAVCEFYSDENGNQHFMLFGQHGATGEETADFKGSF